MVDIDLQFVCVLIVAISTFQSADADCCYGSVVLQTDETYSDQQECVRITCQSDGTWTALGCGLIRVDETSGWTVASDPSQPHPGCCPRAVPPPTIIVAPDPLHCEVAGKIVQVGEQYDVPGFCGQNICKGNNEFTQAACASVVIPFGYMVIPEDPSKPYPKCCTKAVPPNFI